MQDCPAEYAKLCAEGWDTVQEAFNLAPTIEFVELLEVARKRAIEVQDDLEGIVKLNLNGETLNCRAYGAKGGFRWKLECDDFQIMIGSPRREWTISVRYISAGLWEHGLEALRDRVFTALRTYTVQDSFDCVRISRADWCFDFYSPAFSKEFTPGLCQFVVAHSGVKTQEIGQYAQWTCGARGETLTIGSKASLQNQIYDKTREITEQSGKTWLYEHWRERLGFDPWPDGKARHVWRLELRHGADYLKERNIRRPFELIDALPNLVAEALFKRRVGCPRGAKDLNRWRWPLHPLFSEAYRQRGATKMVAIGRKVTGRRSALLDRAEASGAGLIRSTAVLEDGTYDSATAEALVKRMFKRIETDPKHEKKVDRAMDRYSDVEAAK